MAKVTSPLFGVIAAGQLGKSIVYADWKGRLYARQYVIPSNPNSPGQQTQRGYLREMVQKWHDTPWILQDLAAWRLMATLDSRVLSGFNEFMAQAINVRVEGKTWVSLMGVKTNMISGHLEYIEAHAEGDDNSLTPKLYVGSSPSYMPYECDMTWVDVTHSYRGDVTSHTYNTGDWVAYYVTNESDNKKSRTGIYKEKL